MKSLFSIVIILIFLILNHSNGISQINLHWNERFNGSANYYDEGRSIVTDNSGNIYVAGYTTDIAFRTIQPEFLSGQLCLTVQETVLTRRCLFKPIIQEMYMYRDILPEQVHPMIMQRLNITLRGFSSGLLFIMVREMQLIM